MVERWWDLGLCNYLHATITRLPKQKSKQEGYILVQVAYNYPTITPTITQAITSVYKQIRTRVLVGTCSQLPNNYPTITPTITPIINNFTSRIGCG